jgi:hypothetical protein
VTFGDFTDDDALDTEPADPEQVARKLHAIRLERGLEADEWEELVEERRALLVAVIGRLLAWLRRQGSLR